MKTNVRSIRKKRTYSIDFKKQIVKEFESGKYSVAQLEKLHSISNPLIYDWIYKYSTFNEKGSRIIEMKDSSSQKLKQLEKKVKELEAWIAEQTWHPDLKIQFRGANEEQTESMQFVGVAFMLSLLLMFVLLVTQFNSFYQAILILFAVVLSTAGVLLGLLITGSPFSAVLTGVGVVALAGIVVNNNIVLIDTYNHLRREHPELDYIQLIVRTGAQRLRPVMLTTITTVFGLLPLASNLSIDLVNRTVVYGGMLSSFWVPLSQAIVSGLTFSTMLTLVTTPAMLALPHQIKDLYGKGRRHVNRRLGKPDEPALGPSSAG